MRQSGCLAMLVQTEESMALSIIKLFECHSDAANAIHDPRWGDRGRVHDWRNYVPDAIRDNWDSLSEETRLVVYCMAEQQASAEEWD